MKNTINSGIKKLKSSSRVGVFTFATLFGLTGCGGGGGGSSDKPLSDSDFISYQKVTLNSQAGTIVNGDIEIRSMEGILLMSGLSTDDNGKVIVDIGELEKIMSDNNISIKQPVEVFSIGGIDIDPDDDGNIENDIDKVVYGEMSSIFTLDQLNGSYINPITTLVSNILKGENGSNIGLLKDINGNIDIEKIKSRILTIIEDLGIKDINSDGTVDEEDIQKYNMVDNESIAEKQIREQGFLDSIHSGDQDKKQSFIDSQKTAINGISTNFIDNTISLTPLNYDSNIYYSFDGETWYVYSSEINISSDAKVYYKEEYHDGNYSKVKSENFSYSYSIETYDESTNKETDTIIESPSKKEDLFNEVLRDSILNTKSFKISKRPLYVNYLYNGSNQAPTVTLEYEDSTSETFSFQSKQEYNSLTSDLINHYGFDFSNGSLKDPIAWINSLDESIWNVFGNTYVSYSTEDSNIESTLDLSDLEKSGNIESDIESVNENTDIVLEDFSVDYPEVSVGPILDIFKINWKSLGIKENPNNDNLYAEVKSGNGMIVSIDGEFLKYRANNTQDNVSEDIVISIYNDKGYVGDLTISINDINTISVYVLKLYCSPNLLPIELDTYKEYYIKVNQSKPEWLKSYTSKDGCSYIDKNEIWLTKYATVYGIDVKYEYQEKSYRTSNGNSLKKAGIDDFRDHQFTGLQRYLRSDGVWIEYNIGRDKSDRNNGTVRRFLEKQAYFFDQLSIEDQNYMLEKWSQPIKYFPSDPEESDYEPIIAEVVSEEEEIISLSGLINDVNQEMTTYTFINSFNSEKVDVVSGKYIPSKNFELDSRVAKGEDNYTYLEKNNKNYTEFPYTSYIKINRTKLNGKTMVYPGLVWIEYKLFGYDNIVYSTERLEANNYEQVQEVQKYLVQKVKERQDFSKNSLTESSLGLLYYNLQVSSNNGNWGDGYIENLKGFNKLEINSNIEYFSSVLFEYKIKNDAKFLIGFDDEVERQFLLNPDGNIEEIKKGVREGVITATRDYLMTYYDLVNSLYNLELSDIVKGLDGIWNKISNPQDTLNDIILSLDGFKEKLSNSIDRLLGLGEYEKSLGGSYIGTTLGLSVGSPGSKLSAITGNIKFDKVGDKVSDSISKLQDSYKLKVISRYKNITGIDDIVKISKEYKVIVGNGGLALTIYGNKNTAEAIIDILKSKGWNLSNEKDGIFTYISPNGLEKINSRTISSSQNTFSNDGFKVNVTFDLMKKSGNSFNRDSELKFLTPNK